MAVNSVTGGATNSQMAERLLKSSGNNNISTSAIKAEIAKVMKASNGDTKKAAANIMQQAYKNDVSAQQLIDAGLSAKDVYGYLNNQAQSGKRHSSGQTNTSSSASPAANQSSTSRTSTSSRSSGTTHNQTTNSSASHQTASYSAAHNVNQANNSMVTQATMYTTSNQAVAGPQPVDIPAATATMYGEGNPNLTEAQLNTAIDQVVAKHSGSPQQAADELFQLALQFNVSAQQLASLNRPGLSLNDIETYLQSKGVTQEVAQTPTPTQAFESDSIQNADRSNAAAPNAAMPYAPNLTSQQAKVISDKYLEVFGYEPSTKALQLYGYRMSGAYPLTLEEVVDSIEKKIYAPDTRVDMRTITDAGIDPGVYSKISGTIRNQLNWTAILNADDPNSMLRAALRETLKNTARDTERYTTRGSGDQDVIAQAGNLAVLRPVNPESKQLRLSIVDDAGNAIDTGFKFSSEGLIEAAYMYGLNLDPNFANALNEIADQLDAQGVGYKPGEVYPGHGSDAGVNLRDMANGGTGAGYIPTMAQAIYRAETSASTLGANKESAIYSGQIAQQTNLEYWANAINIDLTNASSVRREFAPRTGKDGTIYNYMVLSPGGGAASWYETQAQAQAYAQEHGGRSYDLRVDAPEIVDRVVRYSTAGNNGGSDRGHGVESNSTARAPYGPNLTPQQAKAISDKYVDVFGYAPSTQTLRSYGYRMSGVRKLTLEEVIDSIEKKTFEPDARVDMRTLVEGGVDPSIYMNVSTTISGQLDWTHILNAEQPNHALRSALRETLKNTERDAERYTTRGSGDQDVIAQAGNLAVLRPVIPGAKQLRLSIVDDAGNAVDTGFKFSSEGLIKAAYMYGLNLDPNFANALNEIADQLDAQGVGYKPGEVYPGHGSDAGVNLRDMANGGTGAGYIPTMDQAVHRAEMSANALDAGVHSAVYSGQILAQADLEYWAHAIGVDLTKASSVRREFAPRVDKNGAVYNYMVLSPGGGAAAWYKTEEEASEHVGNHGGMVYDLQIQQPEIVIERTV